MLYSVLEDAYDPANVGQVYNAFGIGVDGALVVVRPDGYVGKVEVLDKAAAKSVAQYFAGFLNTDA